MGQHYSNIKCFYLYQTAYSFLLLVRLHSFLKIKNIHEKKSMRIKRCRKSNKIFLMLVTLVVLTMLTSCDDIKSIINTPGVQTISDGEIYVRLLDGNDANSGTMDEPFLSIQAAVDYAELNYSAANIYIAEGTYSSDFTQVKFLLFSW